MNVGEVYEHVSALLDEYLEPLGMNALRGPLRAVGELTRGIVWTGSVQLSNSARLRARSPAGLARMVERLSHHLSDRSWDHREWAARVLAEQARSLRDDDLIPIDATELAKPYGRHFQYQCTIRDASRPGDPLVPGFWCWGAYLWRPDDQSLCPLMLCPYSTQLPEYRSENDQWCRYFWTLRQATGGKGVWVSDRGGDRPEVLSSWLTLQPRWIIRLREDRSLIGPDGSPRPAGVWADWALKNRPQRGNGVTLPVYLPPKQVRQCGPPVRLCLVVPTYRSANDERWVMLTRGLVEEGAGPREIRHDYALRWRSEDAKRFLGQIWHVERFLTRSFLALERMLWCVVVAGGFLSWLQREWPALAGQLRQEVVYWDEPCKIPVYRMARGLTSVAARKGVVAVTNNA
jgi:hypothetical protein